MRSLILAASVLVFSVSVAQAGSLPVVKDATVQSECTDCHMAYPPVLLSQTAWKKILGNLTDHYGDDASLDDATVKIITDYYVENSNDVTLAKNQIIYDALKAEAVKAGKKAKFVRPPGIYRTAKKWSSDTVVYRIQDLSRFKSKHRFSGTCEPIIADIMKRAKIQTMSMCADCHASMPVTGGSGVILRAMQNMSTADKQAFLSPADLKCLDE